MLPSTVTTKTASSSGIFSPPSVFYDLLETKQVLQKRKCTKKSVAHLSYFVEKICVVKGFPKLLLIIFS